MMNISKKPSNNIYYSIPEYKKIDVLEDAIYKDNAYIISKIVSSGMHLNINYYYEGTPLHFSIVNNKIKAMEVLLKLKADPNIKNNYLRTPLYYAIRNLPAKESIKAMTLLINNGARINKYFVSGGINTYLHLTVNRIHMKAFELLINKGADPKIKNFEGLNVIDYIKLRIKESEEALSKHSRERDIIHHELNIKILNKMLDMIKG